MSELLREYRLGEVLRRQLHLLEDWNSSFPVTKDFLRERGRENVRELSLEEKAELETYLILLLSRIITKGPGQTKTA
jgi:hypothetical protein